MSLIKKVTVVLPVYNGEAYLEESINSLLNQSYKEYELIIVDDGSTDDSGRIAQEYAHKFSNIIYVRNNENLKLPESLNRGFSLASGDYWTWTSCDNVYLPDAFERLVAALESNPDVGLVYSDMDIIDESGRECGYTHAGMGEDLIFRNVVGACFLYRSTIAKKAGGYNKDHFLCEDYEFWLRLSLLTQIKPIHESLYKYRRHSASLSYNQEKSIISKGIRVQKLYYEHFIKSRKKAALFYASLRARDVFNPFRQLYLLIVLFYSPAVFIKELCGLILRRFN